MRSSPLKALRNLHREETVYIIGSGPSSNCFPFDRLDGRLTIGLNNVRSFFKPTYWLFGDPKFSRYSAKRVLRRCEDQSGDIVMNRDLFHWLNRWPDLMNRAYLFSTQPTVGRSENWYDDPETCHLPGRWTIATTAISLAVFLGCKRAVMVGIDFSRVGGKVYTDKLPNLSEPGKQDTMMGQWKKWIMQGFARGAWPIELMNISEAFFQFCPDTPIKKVSIEECLSC